MKIDKEKFNKLKQLDRIEFRQKYKAIREVNFTFWELLWFSVLLMSIFLTGWLISPSNETLLKLTLSMIKLCFWVTILNLIFLICNIYHTWKKTRELQEEYFKVEVKK